MKALSIKQPWVWAILNAGKDIENRSWTCKHRGWIAIHASAKPVPEPHFFPRGIHSPDLKTLDCSAICGVARIKDIVSKSRSKWFFRPDDGSTNYGWVLDDVTVLPEPIACKGSLGLWKLPPKVFREVKLQLPNLTFDDV